MQKVLKRAKRHEDLAQQLWTWVFILVYILYPSNSSRIFATLQCETLDDPARTEFLLIDMSINCKDPYHQAAEVYAWVMMIVYPLGVPLLYAYLLFYKYGREMRLLRSLELKRAAVLEETKAATELATAHQDMKDGLASGRSGLWSAATLGEAQGGGSQRSLDRQQSSRRQLQHPKGTLRNLQAAGDTAAIVALAQETERKVVYLTRQVRLQAEIQIKCIKKLEKIDLPA